MKEGIEKEVPPFKKGGEGGDFHAPRVPPQAWKLVKNEMTQ